MANREVLRESINRRQQAKMVKERAFFSYDEYADPALRRDAEEFDRAHMDELHEIALEDNQEGSDFQKTTDERMGYAKTFDGKQESLTEKERERAANNFNELVDDMLLRDAESVETYLWQIREGESESSLLLSTDQRDGSRISIDVRSASRDDGTPSRRNEIVVQEIGPDGRGGLLHRYFVDDEGILRRFDKDVTKNRELYAIEFAMDEAAMKVDPIRTLERKIADIGQDIKNAALERELGVNEQPISPEEVAKLRMLIVDAHVYRP